MFIKPYLDELSRDYPIQGITEKDRLLIAEQAKRQSAESPSQVINLTMAWVLAKKVAFDVPACVLTSAEYIETLCLRLGEIIEPCNNLGYRKVPVSFGVGKKLGLPYDVVPRAMEQLCQAFADRVMEPAEWYREFEVIHPFKDGNGRVGDLFWKIDHVRRGHPWPTYNLFLKF